MYHHLLPPHPLSLFCYGEAQPSTVHVCTSLSGTLAVGNELSDGESCQQEQNVIMSGGCSGPCHHHREFITTSDDDNGLCCKWLWMSSVFGKQRYSSAWNFPPYLRQKKKLGRLFGAPAETWHTSVAAVLRWWWYSVGAGLEALVTMVPFGVGWAALFVFDTLWILLVWVLW